MLRRSATAGLVAVVVIIGATAPAAAASLTITDVSVPDSVTQGESFDLTVLVDGNNLENNEVDVSLTVPDGLSCSPSGTQTVTLTDGSAEATFDCDAEVEGDYTGEITVSATAVADDDDPNPDETTQTGLEVLSPASLTLSTALDDGTIDESQSTRLTAVVHNAGDASTSYSLSVPAESGYSVNVASGSASGTIGGGETATVEYTITGDDAGDYGINTELSGGNGQSLSENNALSVSADGGGGGGGGGSTSSSSLTDTPTGTATPTATPTATATQTERPPDTVTQTEVSDTSEASQSTQSPADSGADSDPDTPIGTTDSEGPGFGVALTVLALLGVVLLSRRL